MKNIERAKEWQRKLYEASGREWTEKDFDEGWTRKPYGTDWDFWYEQGLAPANFCAECGEEKILGDFGNRNSLHKVPIFLCEECARVKGYPVDDIKSGKYKPKGCFGCIGMLLIFLTGFIIVGVFVFLLL